MDTEAIALIAVAISIISLVVATFSVGWNVYRDVILKPRLKVALEILALVSEAGNHGTFVALTGTNFGPGELTVSMVHGRVAPLNKRLTRRAQNFVAIRPTGVQTSRTSCEATANRLCANLR